MEQQQPPPIGGTPRAQLPQRQSRGCFFWGFVILVIICISVGGCVALGAYFLRSQVLRFTSTEQIAVEKYTPRPGEYDAVRARLDEFAKTAEQSEASTLELSQDDLNAFIAGNPEMKTVADKVFARIEGNEVLLEASFPLDGIPTLGGRYFNGTLGVKLAVVEGRLVVFPETAIVNGEAVPETYMKQVRQQDLFGNQRQSGDMPEFLKNAKSLEVRDGKIVLTR